MNFAEALEYIIATLEHAIDLNQKACAPSVVIDTLGDACNHAYGIDLLLNAETDIIHGISSKEFMEGFADYGEVVE